MDKNISIIVSIISVIIGYQCPDGLASHGGRLYAAIESQGSIISIAPSGTETVEYSGLRNPEGIYVNSRGEIFVTEDVVNGRLVMIADSCFEVIASSLGCPEGVAVDSAGTIWFTTGGFEAGEIFSSLWKVENGIPERVYSVLSIFSLSDMEISNSGIIYLCSEASGTSGRISVLAFDPIEESAVPFVESVPFCEGICMTEGEFPMYLASEGGTVFSVDSSGTALPFIQGLSSIEDVEVMNSTLFVSEDGTGSILRFDIDEQ